MPQHRLRLDAARAGVSVSTFHADVESQLQHEAVAIKRADDAANGKPARLDWRCQECGRRFRSVKTIQRAMSVGCPKCNSVDILEAP